MSDPFITGDELVIKLAALASPHRLRIFAELHRGRNYVSELARVIGLSRPLVQMHLSRLESAGLATSTLELSDDGKAMKFYELVPFTLTLDAAMLARAAATLSAGANKDKE